MTDALPQPINFSLRLLASGLAFGARADGTQMIVGINAGGMAVRKRNLYRILADGICGLRARFGLEHRQRGRRRKRRRSFAQLRFLDALVVARRAGTLFAQIWKIKMAGVPVGPSNVHARAAADVNLHTGGLASLVNGYWHELVSAVSFSNSSRSTGRGESGCRAGKFLDGRGTSRCADRDPA